MRTSRHSVTLGCQAGRSHEVHHQATSGPAPVRSAHPFGAQPAGMTNANAFDRRAFLRTGLIAGGGAAALSGLGALTPAAAQARTSSAPALLRARPSITHGVQAGEVTARSALVWTRADRPARMLVDVATRPDFRGSATLRGPVLTPDTDLTGKIRLRGLHAGQDVHYRVRLEDVDGHVLSAPATGRFRTAPAGRRDVRFVWSGDLAGQGWGIN